MITGESKGAHELHIYRCRFCGYTRGYPDTPREAPSCSRCGVPMDYCGDWMVTG